MGKKYTSYTEVITVNRQLFLCNLYLALVKGKYDLNERFSFK
ncbi:MAG: hypothetical protein ACD_78C00183G0003 [uncultured bacterium (gcode 4)]|uniref:Uncharacterized protein n=1 Tax=uncultured bacterium (gcode 4) TaxID=1234023 RepID=K1XXV5_9BACT|nr:MAG: hypothetical protein ACD_78C00183G0003 [uncultured bacterium (gcode 4)]